MYVLEFLYLSFLPKSKPVILPWQWAWGRQHPRKPPLISTSPGRHSYIVNIRDSWCDNRIWQKWWHVTSVTRWSVSLSCIIALGKASCYVVSMPMDMLHGVNFEVILQLHLNFQMTSSGQQVNYHVDRHWARTTHLSCSKTSDPQRLCEIVKVCCFNLLSFREICYIAVDN